jgi:hypothetical protein
LLHRDIPHQRALQGRLAVRGSPEAAFSAFLLLIASVDPCLTLKMCVFVTCNDKAACSEIRPEIPWNVDA